MKSIGPISLLLAPLILGFSACGGYSTRPIPAPSPSPSPTPQPGSDAVISSLTPSSVMAGAASFQLVITGQYFSLVKKYSDQGNYVVYFGGVPLATTYVSDTELTAIVPASSIAVAGTISVLAETTDFVSNSVPFIILPVGSMSVAPTSVSVGPNGIVRFVPSLAGGNLVVAWSVGEGITGGSINSSGLYVAPGHTGTFHIVAVSQTDPSITATATVTVLESGFSPAGSMHTARTGHSATLLVDGRVLVVGSDGSAELFDPATETFSVTGGMNIPREGASVTLLQDGRVLVAGGFGSGTSELPRLATAELYDPQSGNFSLTGDMNDARVLHTATLLNDGRVLIAGGTDGSSGGGASTSSAELYDPSTSTFTPTGSLNTERAQHTATLLANGRVLIAGGWNGHTADAADDPPWDPLFAELFDPASGTFITTGSMSTTRIGHNATLLPAGKVLLLGGIPALQNLHDQPANIQYAEIYDPATQTFSGLYDLAFARKGYTVTLLNSGELLFAGGRVLDLVVQTAELLNPTTGAFGATGSLGTERAGHTATFLNDGRVLVVGGKDNSGNLLSSAELYQ